MEEDHSVSKESPRVRRRTSRKQKKAIRTEFVDFEDMQKARILLETCLEEGIPGEKFIELCAVGDSILQRSECSLMGVWEKHVF